MFCCERFGPKRGEPKTFNFGMFDIWYLNFSQEIQWSNVKKIKSFGLHLSRHKLQIHKNGKHEKVSKQKVTTKSDFYFVFFVILLWYFFGNFSFVISPSGVWCCFTLLLLLRRVVCVLLLWVVLLSPSSARVVWLSLPPSFVWLPLPSFPWSGCCFHSLFWVVLLLLVLRGSVSVTSSSFWWCCLPSPQLDCVAFLPLLLWAVLLWVVLRSDPLFGWCFSSSAVLLSRPSFFGGDLGSKAPPMFLIRAGAINIKILKSLPCARRTVSLAHSVSVCPSSRQLQAWAPQSRLYVRLLHVIIFFTRAR